MKFGRIPASPDEEVVIGVSLGSQLLQTTNGKLFENQSLRCIQTYAMQLKVILHNPYNQC